VLQSDTASSLPERFVNYEATLGEEPYQEAPFVVVGQPHQPQELEMACRKS